MRRPLALLFPVVATALVTLASPLHAQKEVRDDEREPYVIRTLEELFSLWHDQKTDELATYFSSDIEPRGYLPGGGTLSRDLSDLVQDYELRGYEALQAFIYDEQDRVAWAIANLTLRRGGEDTNWRFSGSLIRPPRLRDHEWRLAWVHFSRMQ
jgi:hypothetical protein